MCGQVSRAVLFLAAARLTHVDPPIHWGLEGGVETANEEINYAGRRRKYTVVHYRSGQMQ